MLTTERLILRPARQDDLMDLFAIYSDPHAMRYWSTPPHETPKRTQENLDRMLQAKPPLTYFVIEMDAKAIGTAGGHHGNEIGFLLHPNYWRQGILSEAMTKILPHIWQVTDVDHLFADIDPLNKASVGLVKSLGFTLSHAAQNTFCINGVWSDSVYYKLFRPH